ncbi:replication-relaxation family protein [Spirillospora sp. NBC_00431]
MMIPPGTVSARAVWLGMHLNDRDLAILGTVHRLGLVTGAQIEELHFWGMAHSFRVRKRVMQRLVQRRALIMLPRRVGGAYGGSGAAIYALDPAAVVLIHTMTGRPMLKGSRGPQHLPPRLHDHVLMVSQFYVDVCVLARHSDEFTVVEFRTEPACWWPTDNGEHIKPDAYLAASDTVVTDHWWIEADRGTESIPILRDKFRAYLEFAESGLPGPGGVIPRVLVVVPDQSRRTAIRRMSVELPEPSAELFHVALAESAAMHVAERLTAGGQQA